MISDSLLVNKTMWPNVLHGRCALIIYGILHRNKEELHRINNVISKATNTDQIVIHETTSIKKNRDNRGPKFVYIGEECACTVHSNNMDDSKSLMHIRRKVFIQCGFNVKLNDKWTWKYQGTMN